MEKDIRDEELAAMQAEGEEEVICVILTDEHDEEEDTCVIARMDFDENGEAVYTAPTDEEYEAVAAKYDEMFEDEE